MARRHDDRWSRDAVDAAMHVHTFLGAGMLESTYHACLARELQLRGVPARAQVVLPVTYRGFRIEIGYRIDLLIGEELIVELKAVTKLLPVHRAQLLSYLKLSGYRIGLLINFNVPHLRDGIVRMVNDF